MTATTMATHPTDDSLLAIDTARGDVVVCDVANHKVLSKLKVSRNAPVKFGVFARHSSVLLVNSVESVIKCDYSTGQHTTILHRNDRADDMVTVSRGRVALWALGPTLNRAMIPTQQFDLCHLRPTTDPRCRPYVIVPIVVPPATPPADTQMLDDYDVTALPNVPDIICQASRPGKEDDGGGYVDFFCPGLPNPSGIIAVVLDAFCFITQAIRETRCKRQQHHQVTRMATKCS
ncbi:hypothetical protein PTSG_10653 [Salpingoeca rosetta]|uniref:Uncharacterized protein n=1 Tax=Salpingoeca rosetta (strain ATCC 50818 / BSB-021) TaxID=946362 RepID=F2URZ4_SALR5|nr:uncharacterized protein PTSG_10653 [Salpingoeca rosetta]EGD80399.1 hypothetical protein PTSG_10653 [Salpingoeca rosetta]|eukprot:XP_004988189.1 hypothetical protein PTSG_10653 [Salpingoeca rosetta]